MLTRRKALVRSALCVLLGAVTTWLVAWGIETAVWAGWAQPTSGLPSAAYATHEAHLIERHRWPRGLQSKSQWYLTRLDRDDSESRFAQHRLWHWTGEPGEPPWLRGGVDFRCDEESELPAPPKRDGMADEFEGAGIAALVGEATLTTIEWTGAGWPRSSMSRAVIIERFPSGSAERWNLAMPANARYSLWYAVPRRLELPLRPIWPGFLLNTGFYGALWALPLFGLPLVRQSRRKRKGRCPNCAYDLKAEFEQGCPECGWRRRDRV